MDSDPLPLQGGYTTNQFCDYAARSKNARQAYVVKIVLFKDKRVVEWWRHEVLALSVVHGEEVHVLFFERSREDPGSELVWKENVAFILRGFKGNTDDLMEFWDPDSEEAEEKVEHCVSVLQVAIKPGKLTLHSLARVIKRGPYYGQYSQYHLFSANCWSWARGLLLDVALQHSEVIDQAHILVGEAPGAPMTGEELQVCMLSQYGAWGGLLLRITSKSTGGNKRASDPQAFHWVNRLRYFLVRMVLYVYTVIGLFSRFRELFLGPSNWVSSYRRLTVYSNGRTLDSNGKDVTDIPVAPNFRGFLPSKSMTDPAFVQSLGIPGRYPLAFVTLSFGMGTTISSIHAYISTAFSREGPSEGESGAMTHPYIRNGAVKCSIMRKTTNGSFLELGGQRQIELRMSSAPVSGPRPQPYAGISRIDGGDDFPKKLKSGDTVVLWAEGRPDQVQHPRYASLRVVTGSPASGLVGFGFLASLSFKSGVLAQYFQLSPTLVFFTAILFCLIDTYIEDWAWSALTSVMKFLFVSSIPLPLPSEGEGVLNFGLPEFIDHCKKAHSSVLKSPLKGVLLVLEKDKDVALIVDFEHSGVRYLAEIISPQPKYDLWHYASFVTTRHRLDRDTVALSRRRSEENTGDLRKPVVQIHFSPEGESTLSEVVELLSAVKGRYWYHFWCNDKDWSWPWWLVRSLISADANGIEFIHLSGVDETHSAGDASGVLFQTRAEYRAARTYDYGNHMVKDAIFVVSRTRAVYLIALIAVTQQALSPFIDDILTRLLASFRQTVT